jgi:hypothetical protein
MPVSIGDRDTAERNTILRAVVGSQLMGTSLPDGGDRDEMGVAAEPEEVALGVQDFTHWRYRSVEHDGMRSGPGDLDLTIYGLRQFMRLAVRGNPTILTLLYVPPEWLTVDTPAGRMLQATAPLFLTRRTGVAFRGYLAAQLDRLTGVRAPGTKRPELVAAYGYDTKFAAHALRLGYQGVELLSRGYLTLPMPDGIRRRILSVRTGDVDLQDVLSEVDGYRRTLDTLMTSPDIPPEPDLREVSAATVGIFHAWWGTG